jgi:uncharacterized FAD-dependent dehydrogenase
MPKNTNTVILRSPALNYTLDESEDFLAAFAKKMRLPKELFYDYAIVKKSLDIRNKLPKYCVVLDLWLDEKASRSSNLAQCRVVSREIAKPDITPRREKVAIIGSGPSALFAALALAEANYEVEIFERGAAFRERARDLATLMRKGQLNEESNICYGEGGAGTFSDGKLKTRTKSVYIPYILSRFVDFGAPNDILYENAAHIGTDYLGRILPRLRAYLESLHCRYHFNTRVDALWVEAGVCRGLVVQKERIAFKRVILAVGHSDDTLLRCIHRHGAEIVPKDLAIGFRVEHPQALINLIQYGKYAKDSRLPAAEYSLKHKSRSGLGVYSFCMCPGGSIVPSMTLPNTAVVNGMSSRGRAGNYANAAILAQLKAKKFAQSPLGGFDYIRKIEQLAAKNSPSPNFAPAQKLVDYLGQKTSACLAKSTYLPGIFSDDLNTILPAHINEAIRDAFVQFNKSMRGFICEDAVIVGVETRSSSPIQVVRNEWLGVKGIAGLYCAGECSGFAGGITSSAIDGLRVAKALSESF